MATPPENRRYFADEDLSAADRALYELLEDDTPAVPWQPSDEAILAFAAGVAQASGQAAGEESAAPAASPASAARREQAGGEDTGARVVGFTSRPAAARRRRFATSPVLGLALAASLMIGVFGGQALHPYLNFGLAPEYDALVSDNHRLQREVSLTRSLRSRSENGDASSLPGDKGAFPLGRIVFDFPCSNLTASLSSNRDLAVAGYVASQEDFARLQTLLLDFEGVASIKNTVGIYAWPFCEVISTLQQLTQVQERTPHAPVIRPFNHAERYVEGESLIVEVINQARFDGYVYVDYIQEDGEVMHMLPSRAQPKHFLAAGERVLLGLGAVPYVIAPPFGTDMISIIVSPSPLFEGEREISESIHAYLPALQVALQRRAASSEGERLLSAYTFIETAGRTPVKAN